MTPKFQLAPSILSADFAQLGAQVAEAMAAGADRIHVDVMDGHFVPNITIGPLVVKALQPLSQEMGIPLDVHLMIENPEQYLADFAEAGANILTVHVEATVHLHRAIEVIRELGMQAGVAINPATPLVMLEEVLPLVDQVIVDTLLVQPEPCLANILADADADLLTACRPARIHDTIAALPDGYDTVVGERGYRLSGGEKQRLAIARLLLKDPAIMILDEATSHLDMENESLVQDALETALAGRTAIVIAHRLSTIRSADRIAVIDGGRVAEIGTHDDLVAAGGLYAQQLRAGELLAEPLS